LILWDGESLGGATRGASHFFFGVGLEENFEELKSSYGDDEEAAYDTYGEENGNHLSDDLKGMLHRPSIRRDWWSRAAGA
jgi:hypothetical protein